MKFVFFCALPSLQLAHGADPSMKNQEGQTALDLATVSTENSGYISQNLEIYFMTTCLPEVSHWKLKRLNDIT